MSITQFNHLRMSERVCMCVYVSVSLYDNNFGDYNVAVYYSHIIIHVWGHYIYVLMYQVLASSPRPLPVRGEGRAGTRLIMFAPG